MTQRVFFTRQVIVDAAVQLTREKGWHSVTTRSIAKRLGSSTMPIYSSLKSMEEIEREVRAAGEALMIDYQRKPYTEDAAFNAAIGYVTFARDERNLFRFMFVDRPVPPRPDPKGPGADAGADAGQVSVSDVAAGTAIAGLADQVPVAMQDPRILKSWIFTHGLASMISSGVLELPDDGIRALLLEAGAAFFGQGAAMQGGTGE